MCMATDTPDTDTQKHAQREPIKWAMLRAGAPRDTGAYTEMNRKFTPPHTRVHTPGTHSNTRRADKQVHTQTQRQQLGRAMHTGAQRHKGAPKYT